jgi:hypothetical protein
MVCGVEEYANESLVQCPGATMPVKISRQRCGLTLLCFSMRRRSRRIRNVSSDSESHISRERKT